MAPSDTSYTPAVSLAQTAPQSFQFLELEREKVIPTTESWKKTRLIYLSSTLFKRMGVQASVATLFVNFDEPKVLAGTTVTGKVYLNVNQNEVSCVSIGSRITGMESTKATYTKTTGSGEHQHTETKIARQRRLFMDLQFCLQKIQEGKIMRGQYEYPIQITIPQGSPATMCAGSSRNNCRVSYRMEVWLDRPGLLRWDIRCRQFVDVLTQAPRNSKTPLYIEPSRIPLHFCCCYHRGDVLLGGSAASSVLFAGDQTTVKYALLNSSTSRIKALEINLEENIRWSAHGHLRHIDNTLFYVRLTPEQAHLDLMPALSKNDLQFEDTNASMRALSQMLQGEDHKVEFVVPLTARSTYNGSIIHVRHYLRIKICTPFGTADPTIVRDVQLHSKAVNILLEDGNARQERPTLPANWSPVVSDTVAYPNLSHKAPVDLPDNADNLPAVYVDTVTANKAATVAKADDFESLLQILSKTYDPCGELETYIRHGHSVETLEPEQFYRMFKTVNDVFDQQRFADILAAAMPNITCAKVARAAAGSKDMCRREVVEKLLAAGPLLDKAENAHLIKSEVTAFQYMTIEKYLQ